MKDNPVKQKCKACGADHFERAYQLVMAGEKIVKVEIFLCMNCGVEFGKRE